MLQTPNLLKKSEKKLGYIKYLLYIYYVNKKDMNTEHNPNLIELKSVSSWLDDKKGIIYPMMSNGEYFIEEGISLIDDEVAADWYDGLSKEDYQIVKPFI